MMEIIMYKNLVLKNKNIISDKDVKVINKILIFNTFKYPKATMYTEKR